MDQTNRVQQILEAQLGNMIVRMAELSAAVEVLTAENAALKTENAALKATTLKAA